MKHEGFTLVELLVSLTIASILLAVAIPSFKSQIQQSRAEVAIDTLMATIETARTEAIYLNQRTILRAAPEWHTGWELFIDLNNNGLKDASDNVIIIQPAIEDIRVSDNFKNPGQISFIGTGQNRTLSGAIDMGTITICTKTSYHVKLIINSIGRLRKEKFSNSECVDTRS